MTNDDVARWLGVQLFDGATGDGPTGDGPTGDGPTGPEARLYGLTMLDDLAIVEGRSGGARFVAVAEGDPYALLAGPAHLARDRYDALAVVAACRVVDRSDGSSWRGRSGLVGDTARTTRDHSARKEFATGHDGGVRLVIVVSDEAAPGYWLRRAGELAGITPEDPSGDLPRALLAWRRVPST